MKKEESDERIRLKAYSTKELADLYEVSEKIFRGWLIPFENDIGKKVGRFYNPKQAKVIFEKVGIPEITSLV
ncbi:hypothetical protein BH09BAC5_BH09BAC5_16480 [soil metagenome]|jgi:hypothetical protein